ncbi:MAG: HAD family hydrolase [Deltaproteobacteria bacterium]|jgi:hypothetical protein|nr:HAD family hydrolase [Deltaproteobacteria bacterium]
MAGALTVLDFDGTMTDAEAEAGPFRAGYLDDLAVITGLPRDEVEALALRFADEVAARPAVEGWRFLGHVVAPASVDPYLRMMPVARRLLDHAGALRDEAERTRVLDGVLYKHNYVKTGTVFRPGAGALLRALLPTAARVVTNSHTDAVVTKLERLAAAEDPGLAAWTGRVHGRARKYELDPAWDGVPEALQLPGLDRPVLLRRRAYFEVLDALRREAGCSWAEVSVMGDIFELDLALPLALGARVLLLTNAHTPPWERAWLATQERALLVEDLAAAQAALLPGGACEAAGAR